MPGSVSGTCHLIIQVNCFLRSINWCFSFSKSIETPSKAGWLLSALRASCCSSMGTDFLETSHNVKPTTARGLCIWGVSSLSSFPPAHLLLAGHMWTTVPECKTKAGSSYLSEDLFCLLTLPDQEIIILVSPAPLHTHQCWTVWALPSAQPPGQSYRVERRRFSGQFLLSVVWETVFTRSPCRLDMRLGPTMSIGSYFPLVLTLLWSWQVLSTRTTSMALLHE